MKHKTLIILVVIAVVGIMYYRWQKCQNDCPNTGGAPCFPKKCNFFTGTPSKPKPTSIINNPYSIQEGKCFRENPQSSNPLAGYTPPTEVDMCKCDKTC